MGVALRSVAAARLETWRLKSLCPEPVGFEALLQAKVLGPIMATSLRALLALGWRIHRDLGYIDVDR